MTTLGRAVDLREFEALRAKYNCWGRWGPDDQLGSLNVVSPESLVAAAQLVRRGISFSLAIPINRDGPSNPPPPRFPPVHIMTRDGGDVRRAFDRGERGFQFTDDVVTMPLQCATQWDALSHVFYDGVMYNGLDSSHVDSYGAARNSITATRERMAGRGVLLDLPRWLGKPWLEPGEAIEAEDLEHCCESQGVVIRRGDFVLVRTGRLSAVRDRGYWGDEFSGGSSAGLAVSTADFFCPREIAAVATDTFAAEVIPDQTADAGINSPLHIIMLQGAGIHIGEIFDLDVLAGDCASDGVYEFFFIAPPLTITGAVGSPINPQAIK